MTDESKDWLILDTRSVVGNCCLFWGPNHSGYTCNLDLAGRYTEEEAKRIEGGRGTDIAVPLEVVQRFTVTHVRQDSLREVWPISPAVLKKQRSRAR